MSRFTNDEKQRMRTLLESSILQKIRAANEEAYRIISEDETDPDKWEEGIKHLFRAVAEPSALFEQETHELLTEFLEGERRIMASRRKKIFSGVAGLAIAGFGLFSAYDIAFREGRWFKRRGENIQSILTTTEEDTAHSIPPYAPYQFQFQLYKVDTQDDESAWVNELSPCDRPKKARIIFRSTDCSGKYEAYNLANPADWEKLKVILEGSEIGDRNKKTLPEGNKYGYKNPESAFLDIVKTIAGFDADAANTQKAKEISKTDIEKAFGENLHQGFYRATQCFDAGTILFKVTGQELEARQEKASLEKQLKERFEGDLKLGRVPKGHGYSNQQLRRTLEHISLLYEKSDGISITESKRAKEIIKEDKHLGRLGGYVQQISIGKVGKDEYFTQTKGKAWVITDSHGNEIVEVKGEEPSRTTSRPSTPDHVARAAIKTLNNCAENDKLLQNGSYSSEQVIQALKGLKNEGTNDDKLDLEEVKKIPEILRKEDDLRSIGVEYDLSLGSDYKLDAGTTLRIISTDGKEVATVDSLKTAREALSLCERAAKESEWIVRKDIPAMLHRMSSMSRASGTTHEKLDDADVSAASARIGIGDPNRETDYSHLKPRTFDLGRVGNADYQVEQIDGTYILKDSSGAKIVELASLQAGREALGFLRNTLSRDIRKGIVKENYSTEQLKGWAAANKSRDGENESLSSDDVRASRAQWYKEDHLANQGINYRVELETRINDGREIPFYLSFNGRKYELEWADGESFAEVENPETAEIFLRAYQLTIEDRAALASPSDINRFLNTVVDKEPIGNGDGKVQQSESKRAYEALMLRRTPVDLPRGQRF